MVYLNLWTVFPNIHDQHKALLAAVYKSNNFNVNVNDNVPLSWSSLMLLVPV